MGGVKVEIGNQTVTMHGDIIVDATGRRTLLGRQLRLKRNDPIFNQFAVHAWFEGVHRGSGPSEDYIHICFLPIERGWVWQIPIMDEITSIGVVAERDFFRKARTDPEAWFKTYAHATPEISRAMKDAQRINDLKMEGDYSYALDKFVGDGFLIIGDAARFVDPIFSSGVGVALSSAKFASESIRYAFDTGDLSAAAFEPYEKKLRSGVEVWYEFIRLYYKLLPMFTYFIQSRKHRLEVLRLLQGEIYDRDEVRILDEMKEFIWVAEKSSNMPLWKQSLTDIPIG